jgi:hypothetical protein
MKRPYAGLSVLGIVVALSSSLYMGQSPRPYNLVGVKFCPNTANKSIESQARLDRKYCKVEQKLLKEIWESEQFAASTPLPESTFIIRDIPASDTGAMWFLFAPISFGMAYLSWAKKSQDDSEQMHTELEAYKTCIKLTTIANQNERDFKTQVNNSAWDKQRVAAGFVSVEAMQDRLRRQTEIQDKTHASAVKSFDVDDSIMDKNIAENLKDAAIADKAREKINQAPRLSDSTPETSNKELVNSLIEAMKSHEDGWLWEIIDNQTPLWLIGRQGCGKTWKAATFAMVRKYCLDMPVRHLIDEHATGDNTKIWKYLEPQQISESLEEIADTFESIMDSWKLRIAGKNEQEKPATIAHEQIIIDEYTELKSEVGEPAERFYKRHLKDTRKAKSCVIGVTHNDTNNAYPEGTQSQRESGTILIKAFSANGRAPLPRVKIVRGLLDAVGNELTDVEKTMPDWFTPDVIYKHFNGTPISF